MRLPHSQSRLNGIIGPNRLLTKGTSLEVPTPKKTKVGVLSLLRGARLGNG